MLIGLTGIGKAPLIIGAAIVLLGLLLTLGARVPLPGRLPGDISIRRGNASLFFPVTGFIILSMALTALANLLLWFLRK